MTKDIRHLLAPARVEIDAETHEHVFPAMVRTDVRWNGWACPYFDLDQVRRIAAMVESDETRIVVDGDEVTVLSDYGDGFEPELVEPVGGLYAVGAWSWTWTELPDDAPDGDAELDAWLARRRVASRAYADAANALNAQRIEAGEPYDDDFRARQREVGLAAVAALG